MNERKTPTSPSPRELERLISFVEAMRAEDMLYLDDVGWFHLRCYMAYEGRNPRTGDTVFVPQKTLLIFAPDHNLVSDLNGMLREDLRDPTDPDPWGTDVVIHRLDWSQPIAKYAFQALVTIGVAEIAGFGTLRVKKREVMQVAGGHRVTEKRLVWEMSEKLGTRLDATD